MNNPKNILLITTDQQSATMLSCAGNPDLNTPNIDSLAADGIRFEKAYAAQPLCGPQRCSWYTGLMPHQHGITFNVDDIEIETDQMMGQIFRDAGYSTGFSGKWHVNVPTQDKARHGFDWMNNIRCNGADEGIAPDFKRFLNENDNRPFLFSASFNNPHNICEGSRGWPFPDGNPGMIENLDQLPPLPGNFGVPQNEPSVIREVQGLYQNGIYPIAKWDETRWRLHRWYYCRLTEIVDRRIGDLLQILRESELLNDTLIVFTSDHGEGNAHHQWIQKQVLYDEAARVPFLLSQPGSELEHNDTRQLVNSGIDLIPTLCGLAQIECPIHLDGQDWSRILDDPELPDQRDYLVVETEFCTFNKPLGYMGRAVRTSRYKYMVYSVGENREFFADMENDPGETENLVGNPNHLEELERHRTLLRNYIVEKDDIFPMDLIGP
ncbi:sulfatase family protein [Puniceicoccus vermicola]|uniref:Sulfatase-like hydrolase/transferase n=1 Tax=Puniceicoccus vermicola TaxID=388746 RepID=A0A7X1E6R6_9BACT|nr:sulfatase-like hydrolase/transferase [Puniceicoccus vermicola]MBC2602932.1 sulfatase-like hydrolase/transferase [Puniceicoccus vermicola]